MNNNVPNDYSIMTQKKCTTKTINNYNKKDAIEALYDCINKGSATDANYWAAELLASGFYLPLWDSLFKFYFQYIHYLNVNLINYLNDKYDQFNQIKKLYTGNLKNLCNNQELRNHLAEIITILCICKKQKLMVQDKVSIFDIDVDMIGKTDKVIYLIAPYLSCESLVYQQFRCFIVNFYYDDVDNCMYYINWFLNDNDHTITPFDNFSLPPSIAIKSMWLLWKFMLLQYQGLKNSMNDEEHGQMLDIFELLVHLYVIILKRKDIDTCIYILTMIIFMSKCPQGINWSKNINGRSRHVIKQCLNINLIYANLQKAHTKITNDGKSANKKGRKSKKEDAKQKFYQNGKNQRFITLLNDTDAIMNNKSKVNDDEDYDDNENDDNENENDDKSEFSYANSEIVQTISKTLIKVSEKDNDNINDDKIMSISVPKIKGRKKKEFKLD